MKPKLSLLAVAFVSAFGSQSEAATVPWEEYLKEFFTCSSGKFYSTSVARQFWYAVACQEPIVAAKILEEAPKVETLILSPSKNDPYRICIEDSFPDGNNMDFEKLLSQKPAVVVMVDKSMTFDQFDELARAAAFECIPRS